jgi:hypothetical protein
MTPKEKAEQLINSFINEIVTYLNAFMGIRNAKMCALICVDEIMNNNNKIPGNVDGLHTNENSNYWKQVKDEIPIVANEMAEKYFNENIKK